MLGFKSMGLLLAQICQILAQNQTMTVEDRQLSWKYLLMPVGSGVLFLIALLIYCRNRQTYKQVQFVVFNNLQLGKQTMGDSDRPTTGIQLPHSLQKSGEGEEQMRSSQRRRRRRKVNRIQKTGGDGQTSHGSDEMSE